MEEACKIRLYFGKIHDRTAVNMDYQINHIRSVELGIARLNLNRKFVDLLSKFQYFLHLFGKNKTTCGQFRLAGEQTG